MEGAGQGREDQMRGGDGVPSGEVSGRLDEDRAFAAAHVLSTGAGMCGAPYPIFYMNEC